MICLHGTFGVASARLVDSRAPEGPTACPVTVVELAPACLGDTECQQHFFTAINVQFDAVFVQALR